MRKKNTQKSKILLAMMVCLLLFTSCGQNGNGKGTETVSDGKQENNITKKDEQIQSGAEKYEGVQILLSDAGITVNGNGISISR